MFFQLIVIIVASVFLATLSVVSLTKIKTRLALREFQSKSRGIPLADDLRLIGGHIISFVFKPDLQNHLRRLFAKHGEYFFIIYGDKAFVLTTNLELIKTMALDEQQVHINRTSLNIPFKVVEEDSIMLAANDQWRRTRRAIAPALRKAKFMTPNVQREIDNSIGKFINSLELKLNQNEMNGTDYVDLDADDYFHRYSLDLTLSCLYKQNNLVDFNAEHDKMTQILEDGFSGVLYNPFIYLPVLFPILRHLVDPYLLRYLKFGGLVEQVMNFIKLQTRQNLEARKQIELMKKEDKKNINEDNLILRDGSKFNRNMIDDVIDHYHDGKLSRREYYHSSFFLLSAADKTSADAISHTIYQLALHKEKQNKLRESVRMHGEDSEYLSWVINEALRLQPPVTIGCSRTIERDFETSSGGLIPKGTFVVTPTYVIHRLEKHWGRDADTFRPERFSDQRSFHPCQYLPFGAGLRRCPGREFALHEMKRLLSKLVTRYEFTCQRKKNEAFDTPFFVYIKHHEQLLIRVSRLKTTKE